MGNSDMASAILYEARSDGVCIVTLNRPQRHNALTMDMQGEYFKALQRAEADQNVAVIIVTGSGPAFCVGADMDLLASVIGGSSSDVGSDTQAVWRQQKALDQAQLMSLTKPVIAAINGAAAGLGLVLALWCDLRFVSTDAKLTFSFSKRGLVAEHGISWLLPRVLGVSRALDLLLSSRVVQGTEAVALGLANYVAPSGEAALQAALEYAQGLAATASPAAMCEVRRAIYSDLTATADEASSRALSLMLASFQHPDVVEGVASYVERRPPRFPGLREGMIRSRL
jgi:enoyl-CoA hydratase/carnithine racemase